jgi:nucleotide-binding universal stress UspA family protein
MDPKVIVGWDGTGRGRDALALGELLARAGGASLIAVGVYPRPALENAGEGIDRVLRERTEQDLAEAQSLAGDLAIELRAVAGKSPAEGLQRLATELHPDAIAVGSSHHGFAGHVLVGSVSERLLHGAPCPVAIAPAGYASGHPHALHDIGVGFDDSPEAWDALTAAAAFANVTGARLHVIASIDAHATMYPHHPFAVGEYAAYVNRVRENQQQAVRDAVAKLHEVRVDARGEMSDQAPAKLLAARSHDLDLLAVGSRSYGPIGRVLLGSVSTHAMRHSACPVLVTPRGIALPNSPVDVTASRSDHQPISITGQS